MYIFTYVYIKQLMKKEVIDLKEQGWAYGRTWEEWTGEMM